LHDLKFMSNGKRQVDIEAYEKNLRELVRQLKATSAELIWATTTPVPQGNLNPPRKSEDVVAYNVIAQKIMEENKIAVDDLYSYALPKLKEIQLPANVHYTRRGYEVLAKQVVASIESALAGNK
jgi:lysophospholipase L1-like esterase